MNSMEHSSSDLPVIALQADERLDRINEQLFLIQKKRGLTFGTDAFLLAAFVQPQPRDCAVDLGSGTGILPLLLSARRKIRRTFAVEIQPPFADLIRRNAELNGMADRIAPICRDLRELQPQDLPEQPRLIVSNPPYQKPGSGRTNRDDGNKIARHETYGGIEDFCACAGRLLQDGGRFVSVWKPERLSDLFAALRANRLEPKRMVLVHSDRFAPPCAVLTDATKSAAPGLRILPPLFLYEPLEKRGAGQSRIMTPEAKAVYETCSFLNHPNSV